MVLKWKNIRIFVLMGAAILGMSSVFMYLSALRPTTGEAGETGFKPLPLPIEGQEVSLEQAQASVPFKIRLPTNMGTFVQLKLVQWPETMKECPAVFVIYAAKKPSSVASIDDVINEDGIILFEEPAGETLELAENSIRATIESTGGQSVNINGYLGCAGGNIRHCVGWYTETTYCRLTANSNYPLQQLVEMAQSIPVD
jgi:hypothetical protein